MMMTRSLINRSCICSNKNKKSGDYKQDMMDSIIMFQLRTYNCFFADQLFFINCVKYSQYGPSQKIKQKCVHAGCLTLGY